MIPTTPAVEHDPAAADHEALEAMAKGINRQVHRRGRGALEVVPCPPLPGVWGRPFQVWLGTRKLTLPLPAHQAHLFLDGMGQGLRLWTECTAGAGASRSRRGAAGSLSPAAAPAPPGPAVEAEEARDLAGIEHLVHMVNSRLGLAPGAGLVVVPASQRVEWVEGSAFELHVCGSRQTIPRSLTDIFLFVDGMAAAVSLKDSVGRRQYGRPIGDPEVEVVRSAGGSVAPAAAGRGRRRSPIRQALGAGSDRRPARGAGGAAPTTRRAYEGDLRYFWAWAAHDLGLTESYPVARQVVEKFVYDHLRGLRQETDRALVERGLKTALGPHLPATVERRVATLSVAHQELGVSNPCYGEVVRELLRQGRRSRDAGSPRKSERQAPSYPAFIAMLDSCGEDPAGRRDRALLWLSWASGARRSEIAKVRVEDLEPIAGGFRVRLFRRAAVDGASPIALLGPAAEAMTGWLAAGGFARGPVFRAIDRHGNLGRSALTAHGVAVVMRQRSERGRVAPRSPAPELR